MPIIRQVIKSSPRTVDSSEDQELKSREERMPDFLNAMVSSVPKFHTRLKKALSVC